MGVAAEAPTTPLTPPAGATAFPAHTAGLAAYVKLDRSLDLEEVKKAFAEFITVGDNFLVGVVEIENFGGTSRVHLYLDNDGWVVAFLRRGTPTAAMMQWMPADARQPQIGAINRNVLTDAIAAVTQVGGTGFSPAMGYYDFANPGATHLSLFIKTRASSGASSMQFELPARWRLHEASFYHYSFDVHQSLARLDGAVISPLSIANHHWAAGDWARQIDRLPNVRPGRLHRIDVTMDETGAKDHFTGSVGVAVAITYTKIAE
jgi:hypothetical protein